VTAETYRDLPPLGQNGDILQYPYKHETLAVLGRRPAIMMRLRQPLAPLTPNTAAVGNAVTPCAPSLPPPQAQARKVKDLLETADTIEDAFDKAGAHVEIAQAQAHAGDREVGTPADATFSDSTAHLCPGPAWCVIRHGRLIKTASCSASSSGTA